MTGFNIHKILSKFSLEGWSTWLELESPGLSPQYWTNKLSVEGLREAPQAAQSLGFTGHSFTCESAPWSSCPLLFALIIQLPSGCAWATLVASKLVMLRTKSSSSTLADVPSFQYILRSVITSYSKIRHVVLLSNQQCARGSSDEPWDRQQAEVQLLVPGEAADEFIWKKAFSC